jgi:hypothetical protein
VQEADGLARHLRPLVVSGTGLEHTALVCLTARRTARANRPTADCAYRIIVVRASTLERLYSLLAMGATPVFSRELTPLSPAAR